LVLQKQLENSLVEIHKRRREAVWRAVEGLIAGGKLWLTALGRSLPGRTADKHRIKAADRLLGNQAIHDSVRLFYRALATRLLRHTRSPIVAIDWTAGGGPQHYILSAQLCCEGRSLPLYHQVFQKQQVDNQRLHKPFLSELAAVIPDKCRPIIITDAGFRTPWFDAVAAFGWDFIGRIRDTTKVFTQQGWIPVKSLHVSAKTNHETSDGCGYHVTIHTSTDWSSPNDRGAKGESAKLAAVTRAKGLRISRHRLRQTNLGCLQPFATPRTTVMAGLCTTPARSLGSEWPFFC
jgi:hypothetical protein